MSQGSGVGTGRCSAPQADYGAACTAWTQDGSTSLTIDAGNPLDTTTGPNGLGKEPTPNGCLPNQGSTGQTAQASTSVGELSVEISTNFYNFSPSGNINMAVVSSTISISSISVVNNGNSNETYEISATTITPGSIWHLSASTQPAVEQPVLETLFNATQPASSDFSLVTSTISESNQVCGASGGNYADGENAALVSPNTSLGMWFKLFPPTATIYAGPPAGPSPQELQVTITATGSVCTN